MPRSVSGRLGNGGNITILAGIDRGLLFWRSAIIALRIEVRMH
jgi:hypothetical protein